MKKILSLAAIVLFAGSVHAQTLSFGPTVGFGHSWFRLPSDADGVTRSFHPSYNAGAKLVYSFVSDWGISADIKFSGEGGTLKEEDSDVKAIYRLNYLRIPLQGIYFFEQLGDGVRPKVSFGPSFGFLLGANSKFREDGETSDNVDIKDEVNTFDFGLNLAVGANIRLGGGKWLNTDISYAHGFTGVLDNGASANDNLKNSGLMLNVGILFPLSHSGKK